MPKENKNTSRRSRRQSTELDNETTSSSRESVKSVIGSNRYSPFQREGPRRDSRATKENMVEVSSNDVLHSMGGGGIIENGIKYIMFPLHLLRFCIFGTNSSAPIDPKDCPEVTNKVRSGESNERKEGKEDEETKTKNERREESSKRETSKSTSSKEFQSSKSDSHSIDKRRDASPVHKDSKNEDKDDSEESSDEMVTAGEDSDSCAEQWSSANSTMMMNMSIDCENFDRSMSYAALEEPMDISIDEQAFDKTYTLVKVPRDSRQSENMQSCTSGRAYSGSYIDEQDSNSSVDEEIARIFQKQCTSSEDELPSSSFPKSHSTSKYEKTKENNYLHNRNRDKYSPTPRTPRSIKSVEENERERRKKTSTEFVANNKRRKVVHEEDRNERHGERRSENKTREEKRGSRQDTPRKHKSRSSRNSSRSSVRIKESKGKDIKYRETATQTDSAFSDDDVEMVPVDTKLSERYFSCKHAIHKSEPNLFQRKKREQELNYVADNEDSNDGFSRIARKRVSSCSTSSSSTDLGFDERASTTSDTDTAVGRWHANTPDSTSAIRSCPRAPPGFPEVPQNPPLTCYNCDNSKHVVLPSSKDNKTAAVPPAPSPMRHLYYNYPEFMDLPVNVNSSKILNNILRYNYPR